ncbi:MAG: pyridoxal phosphate-dependent aminotransferase [Rhodospirillaceae bacterium]|nr:pyridoxal phosphate-dependent aminotransferase [Rhodospirillaceae bacterium]
MDLTENMNSLGTETAFEVLARAEQLMAEGRDIINLGIGQPDFRTPDHVVEAAVKALRDGHHGYTPAQGILPLREAVAEDLHAHHGATVSPANIAIMPGGKPTMFFAILMFGEPGFEIMYPDPGFPIYRSMIEFTGATPVPIALRMENNFAFSADEVLENISDKTRLIIVNSPGNPTGGVTPKEEVDKLVSGLADWPEVAIMSDEIYSRMLYDGLEHVSFLNYPEIRDRLIVLNGWSKTYAMTGWRLGFSVWPDSLIEKVVRLSVNNHSCVNAATQFAGIAALTGTQDAVDAMMMEFDARRRMIVPLLNEIPGFRCLEPGGAFYVFPNIEETGRTGKELQTEMLEVAGVAAVPGNSFGIYGDGFVRFSYANSTEKIREAIQRVGNLF